MSFSSQIMAGGLSAEAAKAIVGSITKTAIATGTNQATALRLGTVVNFITTVASGTGVVLPTMNDADLCVIFNQGANALLVYPPVGFSIDSQAVNASISVPASTAVSIFGSGNNNYTSQNDLALLASTSSPTLGDYLVGVKLTQTGAVAMNQHLRNEAYVTILDFIDNAVIPHANLFGTYTGDLSSALTAALATGKNVDLLGRRLYCNNISQSTNDQVLFSSQGVAQVIKNANGPLFTSSGDRVQAWNIRFSGDASTPVYTGSNVVSSGNNFALVNCGSRWAYARAVLATGGHCQIIGTCDVYQTADATASGYDIELGVSGTATLYHQLYGIYSSQPTGGILLTDTGSATILGGEFGKLYIKAGTGPAGTNGGVTKGARIISTTTVEVSDASFSSNTFGDNVTFSAATSNCRFDGSNVLSGGKTVTNAGTQNMIVNGNNDGLQETTGRIQVFPNNSAIRFRKADGTAGAGTSLELLMSATNNFQITNNVVDCALSFLTTGTSDFQNFLIGGGTEVFRINANGLQLGAKRLKESQGAAVTAANNLALGLDGNTFVVNGNTQMNLLDNSNWQGGAEVTFIFSGTPVVKHNQAASGNNKPYMLLGSVDFSATADDVLVLVYNSAAAKWYEKGRVVI